MKSKKLYRYIGISLIVLPFVGLYQYLKNTIYIIVGVILVLNSRDMATSIKTNIKSVVGRPIARKRIEVLVDNTKEKEL